MTTLRDQEKLAGDIRPLVVNVMNFSKARRRRADAAVSFDDARTLFHEFGHGLHGLLSDVTYPMLAGTSVADRLRRVAVAALRALAGAAGGAAALRRALPRPASRCRRTLLERLLAARTFNQGFATVEYVASALVDLDFHLAGRRRRASTSTAFERTALDAHRHAGRDRHAAPAAAFRAYLLRRRLCGRPTTATCGRRCSTPTPSRRSRRPATSSIRRPRRGCTTTSIRPAARAIRRGSTPRSAAGCRRADALLQNAAGERFARRALPVRRA